MNNQRMTALVGGGILVALLLVAALVISGGKGALATKSGDSQPLAAVSAPTSVSTAEANAWAEARAADSSAAYKTYLAAFPQGAFAADANQAIGRIEAEAAAKAAPAQVTRVVEHAAPSRTSVHEACRHWVDRQLSSPNKVGRTIGGAAGGCALGAIVAGGNDGRNCAVGAVVGGATGYVTAGSRQRKREEMYQSCVARGGPQ